MKPSQDRRLLRPPQLLVLLLLGPCVLLSWVLVGLAPEASAPLLAVGLSVFMLVGLLGSLALPRPSMAASVTVAMLVAPELLLRGVGFGSAGGMLLHFGWPRPSDFASLVADPELFWTLPPGEAGVNELGLSGPLHEDPKPAGRTRLVMVGDSVSQFGLGEAIEEALEVRDPSRDWDVVNLGVVGYTSVQGAVRLRRWLPRLDGDVVLIGFGWNDHWLAPGGTDLEKLASPLRPGTQAHALLSSIRVLQLQQIAPPPDPLSRPRVWPHTLQAKLEDMSQQARESGAVPLFWTMPAANDIDRASDYLVEQGFAEKDEDIPQIHREYAGHILEAGEHDGTPVIDMDSLELTPEQSAERFMRDGIHFTDAGRGWAGATLAEGILAAMPASDEGR